MGSLMFGQNCKMMKNVVQENKEESKAALYARIEVLTNEVDRLSGIVQIPQMEQLVGRGRSYSVASSHLSTGESVFTNPKQSVVVNHFIEVKEKENKQNDSQSKSQYEAVALEALEQLEKLMLEKETLLEQTKIYTKEKD